MDNFLSQVSSRHHEVTVVRSTEHTIFFSFINFTHSLPPSPLDITPLTTSLSVSESSGDDDKTVNRNSTTRYFYATGVSRIVLSSLR